jgi:hypothetical protein
MGFLNLFPRTPTLNLVRLPNGSFTVDPSGKVLVSTLPHAFPESWAELIGKHVVATFRAAQAAELPLRELVAEYSALRLTARSLRGGAIVFVTPQGLGRRTNS